MQSAQTRAAELEPLDHEPSGLLDGSRDGCEVEGFQGSGVHDLDLDPLASEELGHLQCKQ